jgi:hypothetical protein
MSHKHTQLVLKLSVHRQLNTPRHWRQISRRNRLLHIADVCYWRFVLILEYNKLILQSRIKTWQICLLFSCNICSYNAENYYLYIINISYVVIREPSINTITVQAKNSSFWYLLHTHGWGVDLTTHFHLPSKLRKGGTMPILPPI